MLPGCGVPACARLYLRARPEVGKPSAVEEAEPGGQRVHAGLARPWQTSAQQDEGITLISGSHAGSTALGRLPLSTFCVLVIQNRKLIVFSN